LTQVPAPGGLERIVELAQRLSPSLLPDLDHKARRADPSRPFYDDHKQVWRWSTKEDQWPYGEAAWFIREVLLTIRDEFPDGHWMKTAWYLNPPEQQP
jgi:hypothetical protein